MSDGTYHFILVPWHYHWCCIVFFLFHYFSVFYVLICPLSSDNQYFLIFSSCFHFLIILMYHLSVLSRHMPGQGCTEDNISVIKMGDLLPGPLLVFLPSVINTFNPLYLPSLSTVSLLHWHTHLIITYMGGL